MYIKIDTFGQFEGEFRKMGREDQFSREALSLIYDYLEEIDHEELDVIAICCDFWEGRLEDEAESLGIEAEDEDELKAKVLAELENLTTVLGVVNSDSVVCTNY